LRPRIGLRFFKIKRSDDSDQPAASVFLGPVVFSCGAGMYVYLIPHNPPAVIGARGRNSSSWLPLLASHDASLASQAGHRPARQGQPARLARRAGRARPGPPGRPKRIYPRISMNSWTQSRRLFNSVSCKMEQK